jgi:hypothetical protein
MANAIQMGHALFEREAEIDERQLVLVEGPSNDVTPRARESGRVLSARGAARLRCARSFAELEARMSLVVKNAGATSFHGLRDRLTDFQACAFTPSLRRWLENGSPLGSYVTAVHNWCWDVLLHGAGRSGPWRWQKSEQAVAAGSAAYVLSVLEPAFRHLRRLCADADLRMSLWPNPPTRRTPRTRVPLFARESDGTWGSLSLSMGAKEEAELLRDVWARTEPLQAEVVALNWELSPKLDDKQ